MNKDQLISGYFEWKKNARKGGQWSKKNCCHVIRSHWIRTKKSGKPGSKYELYPFFRSTSIMERVFTKYYNM